MKLEKELVREILLAIEAYDKPPLGWVELKLNERDPELVSYHVMLLDEAGLIQGQRLGGMNHFKWEPKRLTYTGHEFLDTVRDGEVWRRTKAGAEKAGGVSIGLLMELGKAYSKQALKDHLGIELP